MRDLFLDGQLLGKKTPKSLLTLWKVYSLESYSDNGNESGINQMKPKENRTDIAYLPPFRKRNVINTYSCSPLFPLTNTNTFKHRYCPAIFFFFFLTATALASYIHILTEPEWFRQPGPGAHTAYVEL